MISLPPAILFLLAAGACLLRRSTRGTASLLILAAAGSLLWCLMLPDGRWLNVHFLDFNLQFLVVDKLSRIFGVIFSLITGLGALYGYTVLKKSECTAAALYAGGALLVTFAGDYLTLYLGWELMAVASVYLIFARKTNASYAAAIRYLFVHLTGGVILLGGILLHYQSTSSFAVAAIAPDAVGAGNWLILIGVAINAAVVPLHAWLSDSYPRATIGGAVFLSALTTKTAVYVLARVFPGWEILLVFGVIMTVYGVVFAFLADDIRQILAYHIVSQVGFMVAGVGIGTEMAINGAVAHAFCHILYKALLFMGTGAVLYATGKQRLSELGGLVRVLPVVLLMYMVGAVSISGFPLFNGFISKSMTIASAAQAHDYVAYVWMYVASVGTFLSVGIKLPYFAWFHEKKTLAAKKIPLTMYCGMGFTALLCFLLGVYPAPLYAALPFPVHYNPFTQEHILNSIWYLTGTGLAFYLFLPKLKMARTYLLDTDWFYRAPAQLAYTIFADGPGRFLDACERLSLDIASKLRGFISNPALYFRSRERAGIPYPYDPDKQRSPLAWTATAILLSLIFVAVWILAEK